MGAEVVIAVNVEYPLLDAEALHGVVEVVSQLTTLMVESNTRRQIENLDEHDVLITPELDSEFGSAEFQRSPEAVELGYEAARRAQSELRVLQLDEGAYAAWRAGVDACVGAPPRVEFVQIENGSRFSDAVIGNLVSGADGRLLDAALRDREMSHIHALGFIRSATWEVIEQDGRTGLLVQVEPDQRGTDFIESGLELTGGPRGSNVNLKAGYLKTDLDERGSELRGIVQVGNEQGLLAEYYKPLDDGLRWILHPQLTVTRRNFTSFDPGGAALAEWEVDEYGAELRIGREFSRHAGLFLTASRYAGNARIKTGPPESDNLRFNGGEWSLEAVYDRLDNRFLPSSGTFGRLAYVVSDRQLGADADFEQFELNLFSSLTRGRHTAWLGTRFNTTLDDDAPVYALYSGGGFLNMSGFEPDQLIGQHFGQTMLGYRFRLDQSGLLPAYAGMTLEYGGAAARREDVYADGLLNGSLYLGYDSPLGPLYLGLGWSEEQSGLFFVRLGTLFGTEAIGRR
ncbi:MAG: BamA/TamA family outer membrane protein [Xanthomonadales bacterium]|nr:BamA/TamA family outer membrane protein [Xanthomonadales bacterium]